MKYATVCSGIGAPEAAWSDLWGPPEFVSEIEKFPSAVLKHHYPDVPNYGDMTKFKEWPDHELGLICGGTPCQSFSIAGLRKGMDDPRGNLTLAFLGILARYNPRWFLFENVPGLFSSISYGESDFGRFMSALAELGYSCAYRVLDAQFYGVTQRRRRIFVVGHLGDDWRPPFAVLFEPESLRGNPSKSRKAGEGVAEDVKGRTYWEGGEIHPPLTQALKSSGGVGMSNQEIFNQKGAYLVMAHGQGNAEVCKGGSPALTCNHEAPILSVHVRQDPITIKDKALPLDVKGNSQAIAIQDGRGMEKGQNGLGIDEGGPSYTLDQTGGQAVCFEDSRRDGIRLKGDKSPTLQSFCGTGRNNTPMVQQSTIVRRLTPVECERLQGFPDGFSSIPWRGKPAEQCPDGPQYKALGNSMAVPVVRWIGRRIQMWEDTI